MNAISSRFGMPLLGLVFALFWVASPAQATTITVNSVVVTTGGVTYNAASVGWTFPVVLNVEAGQDLVLSQDFPGAANTTTSYNFDTSDNPVGGVPTTPRIDVTVNGVLTSFFDTNQVLNVKNQGSVALDLNEAQNYGAALVGPGYLLFLGYADNVHSGVCGAYATSLFLSGSSTCFPSPFSTASFFQGKGGVDPGIVQSNLNHCANDGSGTCYDAGVIRIQAQASAVPEPATMTLLLTGLAGVAARRYGQARKARERMTNLE